MGLTLIRRQFAHLPAQAGVQCADVWWRAWYSWTCLSCNMLNILYLSLQFESFRARQFPREFADCAHCLGTWGEGTGEKSDRSPSKIG